MKLDKKTLAGYLDLANHHQDATPEQVEAICQAVVQYGFNAAFVNPFYVSFAKERLAGAAKVGTVIAFPLGQDKGQVKSLSALQAIEDGADEVDVSMNVGLFKSGQAEAVLVEMKELVKQVKAAQPQTMVKFIIESGYLTEEEIKKASLLVLASGADFVKTSSGWGPRGASVRDVQLIREAVGQKIKIKVAGGIDTYAEAIAFINAGADRIGTSHAVEILEEIELPRPVQGGE